MISANQFYLFTMPEDTMCPVWCETYGPDGEHTVAPMPFTSMPDALDYLRGRYPAATVDELIHATDIEECQAWARTCPLEQIPA